MFKRLKIFMLFLSLCMLGYAQGERKISGTVTDAVSGETLIGVSVLETGTSNGTITDVDGHYTLSVKQGAQVNFSYIGYKAQRIAVSTNELINVRLSSDTDIDEVIVVGYTSMKKREVTGAVSNVKAKELAVLPVSNTAEALQGRVAGVQISNVSGAPGAGVSVRIRGVASLNASNDPLYIVDGVPVEDALNSIMPADIENISVLKDASSAAIYGSRATNGVILITTKKGKSGKPKVLYNGQFSLQTHGKLMDMVNTQEYIDIYNVATRADVLAGATNRPLIEGAYVKDFADVNHQKETFRVAPLQQHELSVAGGTDKVNYATSVSYFGQEGIVINSGYNKLAARANVGYKATSWLTLGVNLNGSTSTNRIVPSSGDGFGNSEGASVVRYALLRNPAIPVYDENGKYVDKPSEYFGQSIYDTFFGDGYNPVGYAEMSDRKRKEDLLLATFTTTVKLPYAITWDNKFGIDAKKSVLTNNLQTWGTQDRINNPSSLTRNENNTFNWTLNSVFSHNIVFDKLHNVNSMAGIEAINNDAKNKDFSWNKNGDTFYPSNESTSLFSVFGKVDYNYDYKYFLSGLIRRDGSSRFASGNRWGTFYSFSGGWDVAQEDFLKPIKAINQLKLRAGWGVVGNQSIPPYSYSDLYSPNANYPLGGQPSQGYTQTKLGNDKLKWESSHQLNLGIDMAFMNGEYGFSVDYYNKVSDDMLVTASLPPSIGNASSYYINNGKVLNRGVDIELYVRKQYTDYGFSASVNWGFLKNEVLDLDSPLTAGRVDNGVTAKAAKIGRPIGGFYMYEMEGIFQNEAEIVKSAYQGIGVQPGDVKFKDIDGNGVINSDDITYVGSSIPTQNLGVNLAGNWKNFDLSIFFQGAFGHKIYSQISTESEGFYRGFSVSREYYNGYWRGEGTSNEHPRPSWSAKSNNGLTSTRFLEDASYLRLKNIQLGYTVPVKIKYVSMCRVYASATNLFTFTKYPGMDPEMTSSANASAEGDRGNGIDWGTYPAAKTYTIGVNLTF